MGKPAMGLFKMRTPEAIETLQRVASWGGGPLPQEGELRRAIEKVEKDHARSDTAELQYWLGIAWRNYAAWHVRGDDRKPFLEKAAQHLERASGIEGSGSGPVWRKYACEAAALLADEALIRDLDRALPLFEAAYRSTQDYEPLFCSYVEAIYKTGDFELASGVAAELHLRAQRAKEQFGCVPPAPMRLAAKAYRAWVKELMKAGRDREALEASQKLGQTGFATENDMRIEEKLRARGS